MMDDGWMGEFYPLRQQTDSSGFIADEDEKALIGKAMETFHQKTCVRFVPHRGQSDYLQIESEMGWVQRRWRWRGWGWGCDGQ